MIKKGFKVSILMLLISICACGFLSWAKTTIIAYAANQIDCYYLLKDDGLTTYQANVPVGTAEGAGKFVVGQGDISISATANENYQLVGWQVTYNDQNDKIEFFNASDLDANNSKSITLTATDATDDGVDNGEQINAVINFVSESGYFTSGTFTLGNVFENLSISPVFDHIYYNVEISDLTTISTSNNSTEMDGYTLFYSAETTNGDVTTYSNAYLKDGSNYYYYGNLNKKTIDGGYKFYTIHESLTSSLEKEEIDYSLGAFRFGEQVNMSFGVEIDGTDIKNSTNIDVQGVSIVSNSTTDLSLYDEDNKSLNYFKIEQDAYKRTTKYEINFEVSSSSEFCNNVYLDYDKLYIVDFSFSVDGADASGAQKAEILGAYETHLDEIKGNISIYDFYSITDENNFQFLVKNSEDNNSKVFGVSCAQTITKVVEGNTYTYYKFNTIDLVKSVSKYYSNIKSNFSISVDYSSTSFEVAFDCLEYSIDENDNVTLSEMQGNVLASRTLKRGGDPLILTAEDVDVENIGYQFVGFASSINGEVQTEFSYSVDDIKPKGTTIYLCFQKIEYNIILTNYNQVNIGGVYPLRSITFNVSNGSVQTENTYSSSELADESLSVAKMKIGETIAISQTINNGFEIVKYGLINSSELLDLDYITGFNLDEEFIETYNITNTITIYAYEKLTNYTLTYFINPTLDTNLEENVIMAQIDVQTSNGVITKYDIDGVEISEENGNSTALVAKIVVSNLILNDIVLLESSAITVADETNSYSYSFNWFTVDDKSTLSCVEETTNHEETITKSRSIKVVYTMPNTKVMISLDEDFSVDANNFSFILVAEQDGVVLESEIENGYSFAVEVGKDITISIQDIAYGYEFAGYKLLGDENLNSVNGISFNYAVVSEVNNLILQFNRISYHFLFTQYGAGLNGENLEFEYADENDETIIKNYAVLTVDDTTLEIEKPLGFYVATVRFGDELFDGYSSDLQETNNNKFNGDITKYYFRLTNEQFVDLVANYGVTNNLGVTVVTVRLDYLIFTYDITLTYSLSNPKGDDRDNQVKFPSVSLDYEYDGETYSIKKSYVTNEIVFTSIPYGVNAVINVLSGAPTGLSVIGWRYGNDTVISTDDYLYSSNYLSLGEVKEDKSFIYKFSYLAYNITINRDSSKGSPKVYVNDSLVDTNNVQITLYDRLEIIANASRDKGYEFEAITYKVPIYSLYNYYAETWAQIYNTLYVKNGDSYELNTSSTYNELETYYVYTETIYSYTVSQSFKDGSFEPSNYVLQEQKIVFSIEYELLQLNIVNTIKEERSDYGWKLSGKGSGDDRIEFAVDDFAVYTITATGTDGTKRVITSSENVNFYDVIEISLVINKNAINAIDNNAYDLSLGLILSSVQISGQLGSFTLVETGVYSIKFNMKEFMPETGVDINIIYSLKIKSKTINVTSIVSNSTSFYENYKMFINAKDAGFESATIESINNATNLKYDLQFLAKANVYSVFTTEAYISGFVVSGVKIYCEGLEISSNEYSIYGIEVNTNWVVSARLLYNLDVVFKVQPIMTYNGGPNFTKTFSCDDEGNANSQTLTMGIYASFDIQVNEMISSCIKIQYKSTEANSYYVDNVTNAGTYNVTMSFSNVSGYDWFEDIEITDVVTLTILPKDIFLTYDATRITKSEKIYDGTSNWNVEQVYSALKFVDNANLSISYATLLNSGNSNLKLSNVMGYITAGGKDDITTQANEEVYYNLYLYNLSLKASAYNNNFKLNTSDLVILNCIKITKRKIDLTGLYVYDKVYDGTTNAEVASTSQNVQILNKIEGDNLTIDIEKLIVTFESNAIGTNKKVLINATNALGGSDVENYYINDLTISGLTIYPQSISATVKGYGEIKLMNLRGIENKDYVDLIPLNSVLKVTPIYENSVQYADIYKYISQHLKGNNEYAVGYVLTMLVNGEEVEINKNLYLSVPYVKNLTGAYFLTGSQTGEITYAVNNNNIIIDLSQIDVNFNSVFLTQRKILLKSWQIVLIVFGGVLVVAAGVLTFVIIRKRKLNEYSIHEKI